MLLIFVTNDWLDDKEIRYYENYVCRIQSSTQQHWCIYQCWLYAPYWLLGIWENLVTIIKISPFTFYYFYNLEIRTIICKWRLIHLKLFYCRLYFTAFTTVSMPLIVNAKMMIERNTLLKCIKTCEITSASVPNNCSIPSKNPLFIILSFNSQMLVNAPSIILVIMVTSITLLV